VIKRLALGFVLFLNLITGGKTQVGWFPPTLNPMAQPIFSTLLPYMGQVGTRSYVPQNFTAGLQQMMGRSWSVAKDNISSLTIGIQCESGSTDTVSVEYPVGICTQAKFSGSNVGTCPVGGLYFTDPISVSIPKGATYFNRRYHLSGTTGGIYTPIINTSGGDALHYGSSGIADQTTTCDAISQSGGTAGLFPVAQIAWTKLPSLCLIGDSRQLGLGGPSGDSGEVAPSIAANFAYTNLGIGGDKAINFSTNRPQEVSVMQYCSHIISNYGINDLGASETAVQILGYLQLIQQLYPSKPFFQNTIAPNTTSTDGWVTTANQTVVASNAQHIALNQALRAVPSWSAGIFNINSVLESSLNSGLWAAPPAITGDGLHENTAGYALIPANNIINPSLFHYP
jgi:lysophospholipase L1-like esterase